MKFDDMMRVDRRQQRALMFTHMMMAIVRKHLEKFMDDCVEGIWSRDYRDVMRDVTCELEDLCRREGIEILSDQMRADIGLPPRGPDGWTVEEIIALEEKRLEIMRAPMVIQPVLAAGGRK